MFFLRPSATFDWADELPGPKCTELFVLFVFSFELRQQLFHSTLTTRRKNVVQQLNLVRGQLISRLEDFPQQLVQRAFSLALASAPLPYGTP